jgi:hypothetical protein
LLSLDENAPQDDFTELEQEYAQYIGQDDDFDSEDDFSDEEPTQY